MIKKKRAVVFAGNGLQIEKAAHYYKIAYDTGKALAMHGFTVATGGGPGLMDKVLKGAYQKGGHTVGVCLDFEGRKQSGYAKEKYLHKKLRDRQKHLLKFADYALAVPGGLGTMYEVFEVLTLIRKKEIVLQSPLILIGSYFQILHQLIDYVISEGFADSGIDSLYRFVDTPEEAMAIIG